MGWIRVESLKLNIIRSVRSSYVRATAKKITEEKAAKIGIKAFAYKPVVKADLAKTVRKVLDEAKA